MRRKTMLSGNDDEDNDEPMNQVNQILLDFRPQIQYTNFLQFSPQLGSLPLTLAHSRHPSLIGLI